MSIAKIRLEFTKIYRKSQKTRHCFLLLTDSPVISVYGSRHIRGSGEAFLLLPNCGSLYASSIHFNKL